MVMALIGPGWELSQDAWLTIGGIVIALAGIAGWIGLRDFKDP